MAASAQTATSQSATSQTATPTDSSAPPANHHAPLPLPFRGGPLFTGVTVFAGSAVSIRTASNNEKFEGSEFRIATVQLTRSLFARQGFEFSWIIEVAPAIYARAGAPLNRMPSPTSNQEAYNDPKRFARYMLHDVYGVGFAPLSAQVVRPIVSHLTAEFSVTSGVAFFNKVIPYGKATQANFTVAPALALGWRLSPEYTLSAGYALHHLSNASFGASNPGLNSHMIAVRLAKTRYR